MPWLAKTGKNRALCEMIGCGVGASAHDPNGTARPRSTIMQLRSAARDAAESRDRIENMRIIPDYSQQ